MTTISLPRLSIRMGAPTLMILPVLGVALIAVFILSLGIGAVDIAPMQVTGILAKRLTGLDIGAEYTLQQELVLWNIRLPRVLLGGLTGAGLAVAGASLQGIFRNPLADPGLIGSSAGGGVGAVGMIMLGIAPLGSFSMPFAAFIGSLLAHQPGLPALPPRRPHRSRDPDPHGRGPERDRLRLDRPDELLRDGRPAAQHRLLADGQPGRLHLARRRRDGALRRRRRAAAAHAPPPAQPDDARRARGVSSRPAHGAPADCRSSALRR